MRTVFGRTGCAITGYLILLLCMSLLSNKLEAQALSELKVIGKPEFLEREMISKDIKDSNGEICAGLMIVSDQEGMRYDSYNKIVRINSLPGKDLLFLSPSEEAVTVYKSGYSPLQIVLRDRGIKLESGKVWQIKITGDPKSETIPVNIISSPVGAEIFIDGVSKGVKTTQQLSIGRHVIKITLPDYKTVTDTIDVSLSNNLFPYTLSKIKAVKATFKSIPEDALIVFDGKEIGRTNKEIFAKPGIYKLKIQKVGYFDIEKEIEINETGKNEFSYNLLKNSAYLVIKITPEDAELTIDGENNYAGEIEVKPGKHLVEIKKQNYLTIRDTLSASLGERNEKEYVMIKNTAQLSITLVPVDAQVEINGQFYYDLQKIELAEGTYLIEAKLQGYEPFSETLSIQRNSSLNKKITLVPITGSLQVIVQPIEAKISLRKNSKLIDSWVGSHILDSLIIGNYSLTFESSGYTTETKDVEIIKEKNSVVDIALQKQVKAYTTIKEIITDGDLLKNASLTENAGEYTITFDLNGELEKEYEVKLFLMEKGNPEFEKELSLLKGDFGKGKLAGRSKSIRWNYNEEFKGGLINDKIYLKLYAEKIGGGIPWYVWAGGAVVGGVVAILAGGGGSGNGSGTTPTAIPAPPARPGN